MKLTKEHSIWFVTTLLAVALAFLWSVLKFDYASKPWLALLILIPIVTFYLFKTEEDSTGELSLTTNEFIKTDSFSRVINPLLKLANILGLSLLFMAMALPQERKVPEDIYKEGIDIILALDVSSSMLATDFEPNRLAVSKKLAKRFVMERENDRIGVVLFAAESFPRVPLTSDNALVINALEEMDNFKIVNGRVAEMKLQNGTSIGLGLASAVNRLKDSKSKSKAIILLTDGVEGRGKITPARAAELAKVFGITIYTIGMGTNGTAVMPYTEFGTNKLTYKEQPVEIDEELLYAIAQHTGGKYFRATTEQKLKSVYDEIDRMEKTRFQESIVKTKSDASWKLLLASLLLFLSNFILKNTLFRSVFS